MAKLKFNIWWWMGQVSFILGVIYTQIHVGDLMETNQVWVAYAAFAWFPIVVAAALIFNFTQRHKVANAPEETLDESTLIGRLNRFVISMDSPRNPTIRKYMLGAVVIMALLVVAAQLWLHYDEEGMLQWIMR